MSKELIEALERISKLCPRHKSEYSEHVCVSDFGGNVDDWAREMGLRASSEVGDIARATLSAAPAGNDSTAVATLQRLGYTDNGGQLWKPPLGKRPAWVDQPEDLFELWWADYMPTAARADAWRAYSAVRSDVAPAGGAGDGVLFVCVDDADNSRLNRIGRIIDAHRASLSNGRLTGTSNWAADIERALMPPPPTAGSGEKG